MVVSFIGIDPGVNGAIALWTPAHKALVVEDMPALTLKKSGGKERREVDGVALAHLLHRWCVNDPVALALIERAGANSKDGAVQAFSTGRNFGIAYGVLCAQFVTFDLVTPVTWKTALGVPRGDGSKKALKDGSRHRASQLLPAYAENWKLVKHDGRAEAVLIAIYAEVLWRKRMAEAA